MRLKPEKIEHLASVIYKSLAANEELSLTESEATIVMLIKQVITADLQMEVDIEDEARRLLEEKLTEAQLRNVSVDKLVMKAKQKIAQERKMVL